MGDSLNTKNYDYSIAFAKVFFSFCVVCCHYWQADNIGYYSVDLLKRMCSVAVLVFMIMSFFLMVKMFDTIDAAKFKKRIWRLAYPFYFWGILYYILYILIDKVVRLFGVEKGLELNLTIKDLLWQLLLGSDMNLCPPLWFQFDLIVLTCLFVAIFYCTKNNRIQILIILLLLSLWLQYSGLNLRLFGSYNFHIRYSTGRLAEVMPLAVVGYLLSKVKKEMLRQYRLFTICICIVFMIVISYYGLFTGIDGFAYGGTYLLVYATSTFLLFYAIPFEKLPEFLRKIIRFLAKYSFGVFCLHYGVGYCWNKLICTRIGMKEDTLIECICIYIVCIVISYFVSLIPTKYAKQLVE